MVDFQPFPKVYRLFREVTITEKIDGTNSGIVIQRYPHAGMADFDNVLTGITYMDDFYTFTAQSRNRLLSLDSDNFGFARWVHAFANTLVADLGEGTHFGEWWGLGIQRGYDQDYKHFSLFNTTRWAGSEFTTPDLRVTPILYQGNFSEAAVRREIQGLKSFGSVAAPGFDRPEGVVTYFKMGNVMYKTTIEGDDASKFEMER